MNFLYMSSRNGQMKSHHPDIVAAMREYLIANIGSGYYSGQIGDLHDLLLNFRYKGERSMIHQLAPFMEYLIQYGKVW